MLKGFFNILTKELKELIRDPKILLGMIIVPLVMFPILGGIMSYSMQTAQEQAQKATLLVINNDGGNWSDIFINLLEFTAKIHVEEEKLLTDEVVQQLLSKYNTTQIIEIPEGFSENITKHFNINPNITATVRFYGVLLVVDFLKVLVLL